MCFLKKILKWVASVKPNLDQFPADFMFMLSQEAFENLKSQVEISSLGVRLEKPVPLVLRHIWVFMDTLWIYPNMFAIFDFGYLWIRYGYF